MAIQVMIVEDEATLLELLSYNFEKRGYRVETYTQGDAAEARLKEHVPDLLVLDWMLPGVSGIELCRRLRQKPRTRAVPLIMLSARRDKADVLRGLENGADDYLVKPFSIEELILRAQSLLQRVSPYLIETVLRSGLLELDRSTLSVKRAGVPVSLTTTEFRLLEYMMRAPGKVFNRNELLDGVWGQDSEIDDRTVDVHIGRLRKALMAASEDDPIRTVRSNGYSLNP
jgi:two-component system phosphate regulon response regulator PhoB